METREYGAEQSHGHLQEDWSKNTCLLIHWSIYRLETFMHSCTHSDLTHTQPLSPSLSLSLSVRTGICPGQCWSPHLWGWPNVCLPLLVSIIYYSHCNLGEQNKTVLQKKDPVFRCRIFNKWTHHLYYVKDFITYL